LSAGTGLRIVAAIALCGLPLGLVADVSFEADIVLFYSVAAEIYLNAFKSSIISRNTRNNWFQYQTRQE